MAERLIKSLALSLAVVFIISTTELETAAAVLTALAIHESGHLIALSLMGLQIKGICLEPTGLRINYMGQSSFLMDVSTALAGPIAGLLYAGLLFALTKNLSLSAEISIVYSLFNLLPIMPLDGGRVLKAMCEKIFDAEEGEWIMLAVSYGFSVLVAALGLAAMLAGEGGGLFAAGIWLLLM